MSPWRSVSAQVARMRELAPYMQESAACDALAIWRGPLQPLQRTYTVTIIYVGPLSPRGLELVGAFVPSVRLDEPVLRFVHPRTGKDVPHVY